ncbi:MAG: hypothetical protein H6832_09450 [Planctomycetes bacterium]|nr:hypothetical protein [Planctomycetota bacterium]
MKPFRLFASCLPGLEPLLDRELDELGIGARKIVPGGVEFLGHASAVMRVCLGSGIATRVLLRFERFRATRFETLRRRTSEIEWEQFLRDDEEFDVRADVSHCRLWHAGGVEERIAHGILDRLGLSVSDLRRARSVREDRDAEDVGAPSQADADSHADAASESDATLPVVRVRAQGDRFGLALDLSGAPLWRRGYRLETAKAPLREDLAHALVRVALEGCSESAESHHFGDPFCGSGTIGIEAAGLLHGMLPGRSRRFAIERTRLAVHANASDIARQLRANRTVRARVPSIVLSDRDAGAIEAARHNATRAGVASKLVIEHHALSDAPIFAVHEPAMIVTNPPYGNRVGSGDLRALYQRFGALVRRMKEPVTVALVTADARLARSTAIQLESILSTEHGGQRVRFLRTTHNHAATVTPHATRA